MTRLIPQALWMVMMGVAGVLAPTTPLSAEQSMPVDSLGRPLYEAGAVVVKLKPNKVGLAAERSTGGFGIASLDSISRAIGASHVTRMVQRPQKSVQPGLPDLSRAFLVEFPRTLDVRRAALLYSRDPAVEYSEPIPARYLCETPDDPNFSLQRFLPVIMAEAAWDVHKGEDGAEVVVGIVDTGVDWGHEDLVDNILQNLGEDADGDGRVIERSGDSWVFDPDDVNGIDDDNNGYADDFVGWDFWTESEGEGNDPSDYDGDGHGTHVAGLAAGRTDNGIGIASISWNVKILATSAGNSESGRSLYRAILGVLYLADNGADIINMSYGGSTTSQFEQEIIDYARGQGCVLVAAAGNESSSELHYPSALPGVVSVAALTNTGGKASYSNYGISIDVGAPGGSGGAGLYSTIPGGYGFLQGTSMASPVVAGVFALIGSLHPDWDVGQLIRQVLGTADPIDDLNPDQAGLLGEGQVNAFRSLTDQPGTSPSELRLEILGRNVADDTGDGSLESGESAEIFVILRNYSHLASSSAVTLTLETDSSFIDIVDDEVTVAVTSDMEGELSEGFRIRVSDEAPSGFAGFTVTASATDAEVSPHSELEIPAVMIANGGVLVWEGTPMATFSGRYLRDELAARGFEVTYLTGDFPTGLVGFDGAFLSFGNAGLPEAARLDDDWKVRSIQDYLEAGGRLYLDGSDTLGWDIYNLVDGTALLPLFGLEGGVDGDTNPIDNLDGHTGTLTEGMQFTGTNQSPVEWIDIFTPSTGATAFTESDYGVVAVQHEGRYGQRTFCFSYTLAELEDGTTTRADLLDSIIEFLDPTPRPPRRATLRGRASRRVAPTQMKTSGAIQSNSQ